MHDISIIILTFRRPELLKWTVASCLNQTNELQLDYEIIIVDNTPEMSAEDVVRGLARDNVGKVPITYLSEPSVNIALARNAGIRHSRAKFVAFIDDDQRAPPNWLDDLIRTQRAYDADAVFGPTVVEFEGGLGPPWDPNGMHYPHDPKYATGTKVDVRGTGNALIRAETCLRGEKLFDPEFGRTGGSDTEFFKRLSGAGRHFVWSSEAFVWEFIPRERQTKRYILRRALREGQTYVRAVVRNSEHPILDAAYCMAAGCAQIMIWFVPSIVLAPFDPVSSVRAQVKCTRALGKIAWGSRFSFSFYG